MTEPAANAATAPSTSLMVLMFTDLVGSVALKTKLGATAYAALIGRHDAIFRGIVRQTPGAAIMNDTGDGFLTRFASAPDAVSAALRFQYALHHEPWDPEPIAVRIGLHIGQVAELDVDDDSGKPKLVGLAADMAARVMDLGDGGQILMTRTCFDDARQYVRQHPPVDGDEPPELKWMAHGPYLFKGSDEPMDVFEVGATGLAPLREPPDSNKARRAVKPGEEELLGWRPAVGLTIPGREKWTLQRKLGEGGFGEVWLGKHATMKSQHVFKFCYDADRLRSFKRELTLFRLLRTALGQRRDIATIHEVRLDRPPFFLESAYSEHGDLVTWLDGQGGVESLPLEQRLELVAATADAVAAAHSVGILHKDIKPSNILIELNDDGVRRPVLADFGIGMVDRAALERADITVAGFTETLIEANDSSRTGTRLYTPPETLAGQAFTTQGDVYALGVLLHQMVIGDLHRPLAHGWERDVEDPLLRDDIAACVAGNPAQRLDSAAALAERLRALPQRRTERQREAAAQRAAAKRTLVMRVTVAAAAVVVVVAAALGVMLARESDLRHDAEQARTQAEAARAESEQRRRAAEKAEAEAHAARRQAEDERRRAEMQAYVSTVSAAQAALRYNDIAGAARTLQAAPEHLRGWEWRHLLGKVDQSLHTLQVDDRFVYTIAFDPTGQWLAAGTRRGEVVLINTRQQKVTRRFMAHQHGVNALAFSPTGKLLVTTGNDKTVKFWHAPTFEMRQSIALDREGRFVAFSSQGKRLIIRTINSIWVRDVQTRQVVFERTSISGRSGLIDDKRDRLVYNYSSTGIVVDLKTNKEVTTYGAHNAPLVFLAHMEEDDGLVISADTDGFVHVWSPVDGKSTGAYRFPGQQTQMRCAAFSVEAEQFIAGFEDGSLLALLEDSNEQTTVLRGHRGPINAIAVHPKQPTRLATASDDGTVRIWDTAAADQAAALRCSIDTAAFSKRGNVLVTMTPGSARLWDTDRLDEIARWSDMQVMPHGSDQWSYRVAVSPDGRLVATGHTGGIVRLWQPGQCRPLRTLQSGKGVIRAVAFSGDGATLWACGSDAVVSRWSLADGSAIGSVSLDALGESKWQKLDPETGKVIVRIRVPLESLPWAAFSPDQRIVATTGGVMPARLWDTATGKLLHTLGGDIDQRMERMHQNGEGKPFATDASAFSDDGRRFAIGLENGQIEVYRVDDGALDATLEGHGGQIEAVAWSPDGKRLASSAEDHTVGVWAAAAGQQVAIIRLRELADNFVGFSPDGEQLAVATKDGVMLLETAAKSARLAGINRWTRLKQSLEPAVAALFKQHVGRAAVLKAIREDTSLTGERREAMLRVALHYPVDAVSLWINAWKTISSADLPKQTYRDALRDLRAATDEKPTDARMAVAMAVLHVRLGECEQAMRIITEAPQPKSQRDRDPVQAHIDFCRLVCALQTRQRDVADAAHASLQQIIKNKPTGFDPVSANLLQEAIKLYEAAADKRR